MEQFHAQCIVFQHLIELPNCDCLFCSTVDTSTGRTELFLVFEERDRIYIRNRIKDTWDELKEEQDFQIIREKFNLAKMQHSVHCYAG